MHVLCRWAEKQNWVWIHWRLFYTSSIVGFMFGSPLLINTSGNNMLGLNAEGPTFPLP